MLYSVSQHVHVNTPAARDAHHATGDDGVGERQVVAPVTAGESVCSLAS